MYGKLREAYYYCPLCGYGPSPSSIFGPDYAFSLCKCCGTEENVMDTPEYKKEWLEKGAPWYKEEYKPKDWNLEEQLKYSIAGWSFMLSQKEKIRRVVEKKKELGLIDESRTVDSIARDLKNENKEIRLVAVQLLERMRSAKAAEVLLKALEDKDKAVRLMAADALTHIQDVQVVDAFIQALGNGDPLVRQSLVRALGEMGDKRAVEPLIEMLNDKDGRVRARVALALQELEDKRAVVPLSQAMENEDNDEALFHMAKSLAWLKDPDGVAPDIKFSKEVQKVIREIGVDPPYIGLKKGLRTEPYIRVLGHKDNRVRAMGATALGSVGDKIAIEPLKKALEDEEENVRKAAERALKEIERKNR